MEALRKTNKLQAFFLCILAGTLDAYTYLCRGKVFCNAQTGNIIRMFMALSEKNYYQVFTCIFCLAVFLAGLSCGKHFLRHSQQFFLLFEGIILLLNACIPNIPLCDFFCCMSISFCCAIQMSVFCSIDGLQYTSTVCTGNLKKVVQCWQKKQRKQSIFYGSVVLCFGFGVFLETIVCKSFNQFSILTGLLWIIGAFFTCPEWIEKRQTIHVLDS